MARLFRITVRCSPPERCVAEAHQGVEHDAMNILVLGGRTVGPAVASEMVHAYLAAEYTHEARHEKRLAKVLAIEARYSGQPGAAVR